MSEALARRYDPSTSHEAAARVQVEPIKTQILMALQMFPYGATTKQLAEFTGIDRLSISPRMKPLTLAGKVRDSGTRLDGSTVYTLVTA